MTGAAGTKLGNLEDKDWPELQLFVGYPETVLGCVKAASHTQSRL